MPPRSVTLELFVGGLFIPKIPSRGVFGCHSSVRDRLARKSPGHGVQSRVAHAPVQPSLGSAMQSVQDVCLRTVEMCDV